MTPTFSVIIPTYERPAELSLCLAALCGLDYPRTQFEVIVVNDGGCSVNGAVAPFLGQMNVTHITQKHSGPAAARNAGVALAQGRYAAFTDDDCRADRAWLTELERYLGADESVLVGGRIINKLEDNAFSVTSQLLVTYLYAYYNSNCGQALFFTSNNIAMARETFLTIGGFNSKYQRTAAEDRELCDRWTHSGRRMVYADTALIRHSHRLTLRSFWRQHFQYGQGALSYWQARAQRDAGPLKFEPLHFYTGLLRYPWTAGARRPLRIAALLFIAQMANAMGFFWAKTVGSGTPSPCTMKTQVQPPCP
jgi:cellulose synthase/poly-beta-1,6-N-acetylglucosamine synthase-like glycosyltransferase